MKVILSDSYQTAEFNFEIEVINAEIPKWFVPKLEALRNIGPPAFLGLEKISFISVIEANLIV